jgi:hypothetical protein
VENPRDELNLPSAVAIQQRKVALVVVFGLYDSPLPSVFPLVCLKLALASTFVTCHWLLIGSYYCYFFSRSINVK